MRVFFFFAMALLLAGCRSNPKHGYPNLVGDIIKGPHGLAFVQIPAGRFTMGDQTREADAPLHEVIFPKPFLMACLEVTQAQWTAVMGSNPSFYKDPIRPVENVSWNDVQTFISKLNNHDPEVTYRLPTEAEWEYAARAGSSTRFCFGDDVAQLDQYAWTRRNSGKKHHPVGTLKPNKWGLYDMHGNVWEWCSDYYAKDAYLSHDATAPKGPSHGSERVYRGGSFHYAPQYSQSGWRLRFRPDYKSIFIGFRLVMEREAVDE